MKERGKGKTRFLCYRQDDLITLWDRGLNDCEIADTVGCTPSAIWQWRRKNDFPKNCERGKQRRRGEERKWN